MHQQVVNYLNFQYPEVIFRTDFAAGMKLSIGQAIKHKNLQSGRSFPDLFVAEPRGGYHGLFLELKRDGTKIFKRDGTVLMNEHLLEQAQIIARLVLKGYYASFSVGFDGTQRIIDWYFKL